MVWGGGDGVGRGEVGVSGRVWGGGGGVGRGR